MGSMGVCGIYVLAVRGRPFVRREGVRRGCMLVIEVGDMLKLKNQLGSQERGKGHT